MQYGLIGEHLGHSFSKLIHERLSDDSYDLCELRQDELAAFLERRDFSGINVTIPYKQAVMPHLDELGESAAGAGAVNTIVNRGGKLYGYNTDYDGFIAMSRLAGADFSGARVVILGAGGAAKAVRAASMKMGAASVVNAVRTPRSEGQFPVNDPATFDGCNIIVNATPVGMFPNWQDAPINLAELMPRMQLRAVLDCIYNPLRTSLVLDAEGICSAGGLMMLVAQAVKARELFTGEAIPDEVIDREYEHLLKSKRNIVLCGMPSSGKSAVGKALADRTGRRFVDIDDITSLQAGMEIPDIFALEGEKGFRKRESIAIESVSAEQGLIIATGGGSVLNAGNVRMLRHNGLICFLKRDLELLDPGTGRPLAPDRAALRSLYEKRMPIYSAAAEVTVENNTTLEQAVSQLLDYVE